jgi:hypothetical protein
MDRPNDGKTHGLSSKPDTFLGIENGPLQVASEDILNS